MAAWTDEESVRLGELHGDGKSLHFIAGEMGRSKDTIGRHAERLGLSFDRSFTAKAAESVHVDNKARRVTIEQQLLAKVTDMLGQLDSPSLVYSFGGQFNEYSEHILDKPEPIAQKHILSALSIAITAANKLHDMNAGVNATDSMSALTQMQSDLQAFAKAYEREEATDATEPNRDTFGEAGL